MIRASVDIDADVNAGGAYLRSAWEAYRDAAADFGNPSSAHQLGATARHTLDAARAEIAAAIGARPDEIVLCSGGTEADALAIRGTVRARDGKHVVSTVVEHAAVAQNLDALERAGIQVTRVAVGRSGRVDPAAVAAAIRPDTALVSVVLGCNETGVVQPLADIAAVVGDVPLHTDAVQAAGRVDVDVKALGVSLLSLSSHKLGAVGGTGVLYVAPGHVLEPEITGGGQEAGMRAGTENVAGAASLAAALRDCPWPRHSARVAGLRDRLESEITARLDGVEVIGKDVARLCNTSCSYIDGCDGDAVMMALDVDGIAISTGSACSTGSIEPSPILLGMGLSAAEALRCVRISLGWAIEADGVARIVESLRAVVTRLRAGT